MSPFAANLIDPRKEIAVYRLQLAKEAEDGRITALNHGDIDGRSTGIEWQRAPIRIVRL